MIALLFMVQVSTAQTPPCIFSSVQVADTVDFTPVLGPLVGGMTGMGPDAPTRTLTLDVCVDNVFNDETQTSGCSVRAFGDLDMDGLPDVPGTRENPTEGPGVNVALGSGATILLTAGCHQLEVPVTQRPAFPGIWATPTELLNLRADIMGGDIPVANDSVDVAVSVDFENCAQFAAAVVTETVGGAVVAPNDKVKIVSFDPKVLSVQTTIDNLHPGFPTTECEYSLRIEDTTGDGDAPVPLNPPEVLYLASTPSFSVDGFTLGGAATAHGRRDKSNFRLVHQTRAAVLDQTYEQEVIAFRGCQVPGGEENPVPPNPDWGGALQGGGVIGATVAIFSPDLQDENSAPHGDDFFEARKVRETLGTATAHDGCWDKTPQILLDGGFLQAVGYPHPTLADAEEYWGNTCPRMTFFDYAANPGKEPEVDAASKWRGDVVGWDGGCIAVYGALSAPCFAGNNQRMVMMCDGDGVEYASHTVEAWVVSNHQVESIRAGAGATHPF